MTNYLYRAHFFPLLALAQVGRLIPHGTFTTVNTAIWGRPRSPEHVLQPGELLRLAPQEARICAYEEGSTPTSLDWSVLSGSSPEMLKCWPCGSARGELSETFREHAVGAVNSFKCLASVCAGRPLIESADLFFNPQAKPSDFNTSVASDGADCDGRLRQHLVGSDSLCGNIE